MCRSGGIGRRAGLKIQWPSGRGGSSPPFGTNKNNMLRTALVVVRSCLWVGLHKVSIGIPSREVFSQPIYCVPQVSWGQMRVA